MVLREFVGRKWVERMVPVVAIAAAIGASPAKADGGPDGDAVTEASSLDRVTVVGQRLDARDRPAETGSRLGLAQREVPAALDVLDQEELLARGVVPILSTKADNREGDNRLNLETAQLAVEYNLPLWNFWPVTDDLPNRGLYTKKIDRHLGDIYLTEEALARHRLSALQALDTVWRAAAGY